MVFPHEIFVHCRLVCVLMSQFKCQLLQQREPPEFSVGVGCTHMLEVEHMSSKVERNKATRVRQAIMPSLHTLTRPHPRQWSLG